MKYLKLDKEMINLLTEKGGMTKKTALEIGLEYPLKRGWKQSLIGYKIEEDLYYKLIGQAFQYIQLEKKGRVNTVFPSKPVYSDIKTLQFVDDPKDVWTPPKSPDRILKEKSVLLDLLENPKLLEAKIKALEAENEYLKMLIKQ